MKVFYSLSFFLLLCFTAYSVELAITLPGNYLLGDFISSSPLGADTLITISANDVVMDLGGLNGTSNVNGITIAPKSTDVTIKNGKILNVTGKGIVINDTCSRIKINNLNIENCGSGAIALIGASGSGMITNFEIADCGIFGGHTQLTTTAAVSLDNCLNGALSNILISDIITTVSFKALQMSGCENCNVDNTVVSNNTTTGSFQGFNLGKCEQIIFNTCQVMNCSSTITTCTAILVESSGGISFNKCSVRSNAASNQAFTAYSLVSSTNNYFSGCVALGNTSLGNNVSFIYDGSNQNIMTDCAAIANSSTSGGQSFAGFRGLNTANGNALIGCLALYNNAVTLNSIGMVFEATVGSNWLVRNCQFNRNIGTAGSFGIIEQPVAFTQLCFQNSAFNNGTTIANQITGFPAGSLTTPAAPATSNINNITSPWTNGAITT